MRTLKYALLGHIMLEPKTGYDLMREFDEGSSHTWHASHSQIYPELRRLTEEGLIQYETAIQGRVLEKKVYTVTERGAKEFVKWMLEDDTLFSLPKDEFRLKLFYLGCIPPADFIPKISAFREKRMQRLTKTRQALEPYVQSPPEDSRALGDYLVLMGSRMRDESYIAWLDLCLEKITAMENARRTK